MLSCENEIQIGDVNPGSSRLDMTAYTGKELV